MKPHITQTTQQEQRLILTPTMKTALQVLQMPRQELAAFLEHQLEENPMLEFSEESSEESQEARAAEDNQPPEDDAEDEAPPSIESHPTNPPTLQESLRLQLGCLALPEADQRVGELLIEHLDEHGYLATPIEELAQAAQAPPHEVERLLCVIHTCDPPGVGARDLQECLLIQLHHRGLDEGLAAVIVRDHFTRLCARHLTRLAAQCQRPLAEVEAAYRVIQQLEPKPGRALAAEPAAPLIPDLVMRAIDDSYEVELHDEDVPRLSLSATYRRMLQDPNASAEVTSFLHDRFRQAVWLIRAIEQRRATLLAIGRCLLSVQREFFERGPGALKPLTQAQVAQLIGRHPSTVGRAIAGKSMETPCGVIPLSRFFASRIPQGSEHESLSDATIKAEIEALIAQEDSAAPFSDEAIARQLRNRQLSVARRTVAKYRNALNILPAHFRRRATTVSGQGQVSAELRKRGAPPTTHVTPETGNGLG